MFASPACAAGPDYNIGFCAAFSHIDGAADMEKSSGAKCKSSGLCTNRPV